MAYLELISRSPLVACTWELTTAAMHEQRVVPDACVDLIWTGEGLILAGPDTGPRVVAFPPGTRLVGVRVRPGLAAAVLGLPASELRDISPDAADVLGRDTTEELLESLDGGSDPHRQLFEAFARDPRGETDELVLAALRALGTPAARVDAVAGELGVSARQLQRRVTRAVGFGPKTLARVLRFRRLQTLTGGTLAERAIAAGYADQAHMTSEVTRLAGIQPVPFLKDLAPTAA